MSLTTKKYIYSLVTLGLVLSVPLTALAFDLTTRPGSGSFSTIASIIDKVLTPIWQLAAGLAVIMFVYAGILFLTSMGDASKLTTARSAVLWAVVGIIVAVLAFSIIGIVNSWFS